MSLSDAQRSRLDRITQLRWGLLLLVTVATLGSSTVVGAQERDEKIEIFNGTQGNYHLVMRVLPSVPVVGPVNFTVEPTLAADGQPVRDAEITLVAHDAEGTPTYQVRALSTPSTQEEYIGNISINSPGSWQIHIEMTTEDFGEEVFVAQLSVAPVAVGGNQAGGIIMLMVVAAFVLAGVWIWFSSRRALARRSRLQTTA